MASPARELERAMRALRGEEGLDRTPRGTLVEQLRALYGSNQAVADAAGRPTAAKAGAEWRARHGRTVESWNALSEAQRRRWERAAGSPDAGLEAYRNGLQLKEAREPWTGRAPVSPRERAARDAARRSRQGFLRNLQRYQDGTRQPDAQTRARLEELRSRKLEERREASTLVGLAELFRDEGVTVRCDELTMGYDSRERSNLPPVTFGGRARVAVPSSFIDAVAGGSWASAAEIFWQAWGAAYGAWLDPEDVRGLDLIIGNDSRAYGYASAA